MNQTVRLHRDDHVRRDTGEPVRAAAPDSAEAVLAHGHAWLRFPRALEAEFAAETLEPRRKLLTFCAVLGCLGVILGSGNVNEATPEIAAFVWQLVWIWMGFAFLALVSIWLCPVKLRRGWHAEGLTALLGTAMALLVAWMGSASQADTAITHSAMASIPVMYACIAARLRFYWSLSSALITFVYYALTVKGHTPAQAQIAQGLTHLIAMSYAFGLLANYAFEHRERRNWLLRKVEAQQRETLLQTSAQLHQLSTLDPLTGLPNRRQFDLNLQQAIDQATWTQKPLALLTIDVDYFKRFNDSHGHPAGDTCLIEISRTLATQALIHSGTAARLGGEEFAIILPGLDPALARQAGERVCQAVAAARMPHRDSPVASHVTISAGMAVWQADLRDTPASLQERADRALYQAKANGRNQLCVAPVATAQTEPSPIHVASPPPPERWVNEMSEEDERDEEDEALCQQTLESQFLQLRFPEPLESAYITHHAEARRKQLAITALVGLLIFNVSAIANRSMFGDISDSAMDYLVWLSACVLFLHTVAWFAHRPLWRETLYSLSTAVVALASTWVFSKSQLTSTLSYSICLMLIPMFSGVAARQPFWFTCIPSLITSAAVALMLKPIGHTQEIVYGDNLFMIVNNMVYTLILAYTLDHGARKAWLLARIDGLQRSALLAASHRLKALSVVDPLTGICNRRQFEDDLDRIWRECLEDQRPLGMLIIDVDHFKLYNDRLGHLAGDECLKLVATLLSKTAQADKGLAARLGGEEFGVLLPGGSLAEAMQLAERIRLTISQACIAHDYAPSRHVTVSIGVASLIPQEGMDRISLFATADKALYEAKRSGRNRVLGPKGADTPQRLSARPSIDPA